MIFLLCLLQSRYKQNMPQLDVPTIDERNVVLLCVRCQMGRVRCCLTKPGGLAGSTKDAMFFHEEAP